MAVGPVTYGSITAFVNPIWAGALLVAREANVMAPLVRNFNDRSGMALRHNSQYGSATVSAIAETDDLASQQFTAATISTLTPAEYGDQFLITDLRMESDPFPVRADAAQELGQGMAEDIDRNLITNFTSFTAGTIGSAGSILTWAYTFAMQTALRNQKAPLPYVFVGTPNVAHQLWKAASVAGSRTNAPDPLLEGVNRRFWEGSAYGIDFVTSTNFTQTAGTDVNVGMFSRDALALDTRRAPRMEVERDASKRAWELNMTVVYAHGVWRPLFGVDGLFADDAITGV